MYWHDFRPYYLNDYLWSDLGTLHREINSLFSRGRGAKRACGYPAVNVWSNEDGIKLTAKLPGIDTEKLDISVKESTLTLSGSLAGEELVEGEEFHRDERREGDFSRTFNLPFKVDQEKIEAEYKNGLLTVTLPGRSDDKPRRVEIKAA